MIYEIDIKLNDWKWNYQNETFYVNTTSQYLANQIKEHINRKYESSNIWEYNEQTNRQLRKLWININRR